jgi:uncharacterized protein (DUF1810 family)
MNETSDPLNLERFVRAQEGTYAAALAEIRCGRKHTHWMWYVFPQAGGLGRSEMAQRYAIRSGAEARAYLEHPVLGSRLLECSEAMLGVDGRSAHDILGSPDDMRLRSCATLFASVAAPGSVFERLLQRYFEGKPDTRTVEWLEDSGTEAADVKSGG